MPYKHTRTIFFPSIAQYLGGATLTDFDQDGLVELALVRFSFPGGVLQNIPILELQADGSLVDIAPSLLGGNAPATDFGREVLTADINGDGWDDLIVADHGFDAYPYPGAQNLILLSNGDGSLSDRSSEFSLGADFTHSLAWGDINGDGQAEIWFGNLGVNQPYVATYLNDDTVQTNSFALPANFQIFSTVELYDVDSDGQDEVILGVDQNVARGRSSVILDWTGSGFASTNLPGGSRFASTINLDTDMVDINGDERIDIVFTQTNAEPFYQGVSVQVLVQQVDGSFADHTNTYFDPDDFIAAAGASRGWSAGVEFRDLDDDGDLDMVLQMQFPNSTRQFFREGDSYVMSSELFGIGNEVPLFYDLDGDLTDEMLIISDNRIEIWDTGQGEPVLSFEGTSGDDVFTGSFRHDLAFGGKGNDSLSGEAGNDRLLGETGNDRLLGGEGNDTLIGGLGDDTMFGGLGVDTVSIDARFANVLVDDAPGGLRIITPDGNDFVANDVEFFQFSDHTYTYSEVDATVVSEPLIGTDVAEVIGGTANNEVINGLGGADWITPGGGNDTIDGGAGNDMVSFVGLPDAPGRTNVQFRLTIDLGAGTAHNHDHSEQVTLSNVERITGTIFADYIRGDDGANHLRGAGDYDWFVATTGNDTLDGGTGQDMVSFVEWTNSARNVISDPFSTDGAPPTGAQATGVLVDLADPSNNTNLAAGLTMTSVERVTGSGRQDVFYGDGQQNDFRGLGDYDWFVGSAGGRERYFGGDGLDTVTYFMSGAAVTASLRNGTRVDGQETGYGTQGDAARDLYFEIENLVGTQFDDRLTGNNGRNQLSGLDGDDFLFGYGGVDYLKGGAGDDTIDGGAGSDYALFSSNRADYTLTRTTATEVTVSGADGVDDLVNVEYFQFADETANIWDLPIA